MWICICYWNFIIRLFSVISGHSSERGFNPLQKRSRFILQPQRNVTSLERSYPSAEKQLLYSSIPAECDFVEEALRLCREAVAVFFNPSGMWLRWRGPTPLLRSSRCILQHCPPPTDWSTFKCNYHHIQGILFLIVEEAFFFLEEDTTYFKPHWEGLCKLYWKTSILKVWKNSWHCSAIICYILC